MNTEKCACQFILAGCHNYRFNGFERIQPHSGRTSAGKKTENHFFPKFAIGTPRTDCVKFADPTFYLPSSL